MKRNPDEWPNLYGRTKIEKLYSFIVSDSDIIATLESAARAVNRARKKGTLKSPVSPFVVIAKNEKERLHKILVAEKRKKERLPRFSKEDYIKVAKMLAKRFV